MDLDLGCVADFLVLVEAGSYRRAASRLHRTPSALSRRIQRLEHQVGVPLLLRGPGGTAGPTAAGLAFVAGAGPLLQAARTAFDLARAAAPASVRLGLPGGVESVPQRVALTAVRRRFHNQIPNVRLVAVPLPFHQLYDALLSGTVDVLWGVVGPSPAPMEVAPAGLFDRVAVLRVDHPLADADQLTPAELVDLPLSRNPAIPVGWMAPFVLGDLRPVRQARLVDFDATTTQAMLQRTLRGDAVSIAHAWLPPHLHPDLRVVPIDGLTPYTVWVGRRRTDRRGAVLALIDSVCAVTAPDQLAPA